MASNWLVLVVNLLSGRNARCDTEEMSSAGLAVGYPRINSCCMGGGWWASGLKWRKKREIEREIALFLKLTAA